MNPISDYSVMGKLYLIFGGKRVAAYLSTIMLLGFVHASCFAMLENQPEHIDGFRASLSIMSKRADATTVEMIQLSSEGIRYVFAQYAFGLPGCAPFPRKVNICGTVLYGHFSYLTGSEVERKEHFQNLLLGLLKLSPFELEDRYGSAHTSVEARFSLMVQRGAQVKEKKVFAEWYHPWDRNNPCHQVFDFMLSLKKDTAFFYEEFAMQEIAYQLRTPQFEPSPHWNVVKVASIVELWKHDYREASDTLKELFRMETDPLTKEAMEAVLREWQR